MSKNLVSDEKEYLLKRVGNDEKFIKELYNQTTDEGIKKLFLEKNIDLSDQELKDLKALIFICVSNGGKLSDEVVENCSGGGVKDWVSNNWHKMAGVACGVAITSGLIYEGHRLTNAGIAAFDRVVDNTGASVNRLADNTSKILGREVSHARRDLINNGVLADIATSAAFAAATGLPIGTMQAWNIRNQNNN